MTRPRTKAPAGGKKPGSKLRLIITEAKMAEPSAPAPEVQAGGKTAALHALLGRSTGATLAELSSASGWQAHSVRAWLSGIRKRKAGQLVRDTRHNGATFYRLTGPNLDR